MVFASLMARRLAPGTAPTPGRQRIAGIVSVHDAAALHAFARTPAALRIVVAVEIAIAFGIGIDDAANGPVLAGNFGLDAAPAFAITRDHDRALDGNSQPVQLFVIVAVAVIHIHQRRGHISVDGIGVVGRKLFGSLARSRIDGEGRFLQLGAKFRGLDEFEHPFFRRGEQYIEGLDVRVESPFFEAGEHPFGVVFVIRRADVVRAGAEAAHVFADVGGDDAILKFLFPVALCG